MQDFYNCFWCFCFAQERLHLCMTGFISICTVKQRQLVFRTAYNKCHHHLPGCTRGCPVFHSWIAGGAVSSLISLKTDKKLYINLFFSCNCCLNPFTPGLIIIQTIQNQKYNTGQNAKTSWCMTQSSRFNPLFM